MEDKINERKKENRSLNTHTRAFIQCVFGATTKKNTIYDLVLLANAHEKPH